MNILFDPVLNKLRRILSKIVLHVQYTNNLLYCQCTHFEYIFKNILWVYGKLIMKRNWTTKKSACHVLISNIFTNNSLVDILPIIIYRGFYVQCLSPLKFKLPVTSKQTKYLLTSKQTWRCRCESESCLGKVYSNFVIVCQWPPVSFTNKTDWHNITEICWKWH